LQYQQYFIGLELRLLPYGRNTDLRVFREIFRPKREKLEGKRIHKGELRHLQAVSSPNI
jgi:hypothetical protein